MLYFLIPKSRDLVCHNPRILGLKNGSGIAIPNLVLPDYRSSLLDVLI